MPETPENDLTEQVDLLVSKAKAGNADAFGQIYDLYVGRIYRHIYYRTGNREDAEDLTQQVFINAWKALKKYKKTSSPFLAWLMTISRNVIINFYRSRKDKGYLDIEMPIRSIDSNPERLAELKDDQKQLRRVILSLPEEQQQVIIMKFIEGFNYEEIASTLGKTEGAVRVIQHRALKKIRQETDREVRDS